MTMFSVHSYVVEVRHQFIYTVNLMYLNIKYESTAIYTIIRCKTIRESLIYLMHISKGAPTNTPSFIHGNFQYSQYQLKLYKITTS